MSEVPGHLQISIFGGGRLPLGDAADSALVGVAGLRFGYSVAGRLYLGAVGLGALRFDETTLVRDNSRTRQLTGLRAGFIAGEAGVDITPGWWIIRPSLMVGYFNAVRTYDGAVDCIDNALLLAPGLTVRIPLGHTAFMGLDARYLIEVVPDLNADPNSCASDARAVPATVERNQGPLLTGEFGVRF
jgi:hypothetical protein